MRSRCFVLGLAVGLWCLPSAVQAILIEADGVRVGGYFVRDNAKTLTLRLRTADGKEKVQDYDRAHVAIKIIYQLDRNRLEKLSKDNPKAYRDYAEELAAQIADPEAKDMAMRLFLMAAYLDPQQYGHRSLLSMSLLAGTPAEARKCRAMAFLLDPKGDASVLKAAAVKPAQIPKGQAGALQDFLKALRCYRRGLLRSARESVAHEGVDTIFSIAPGMMDQKTFLQWCTDANCAICNSKGKVLCDMCNGKGITLEFGRPVLCPMCGGRKVLACKACQGTGVNPTRPDDVMRIVLGAELWAVDQCSSGDASSKKKETGETNWSSLLQVHQLSPVASLSLETITEFDPRKCLYRNGTWVRLRACASQ